MDVISTQDLHDSFYRKYSIGTNSATRFAASFLSAYNDVLMDLFTDGHITEPTLLTALNEDSAIEIKFLPQVKAGIMYFLQTEGEFIKGEARDQYAFLNWESAKTRWQEVATSDAEAAETRTYPWSE